jgi:hypothetical protein
MLVSREVARPSEPGRANGATAQTPREDQLTTPPYSAFDRTVTAPERRLA